MHKRKITIEQEPIWDFSQNATITGKLLSVTENLGPYNSKLYRLETDFGCYGIWGSTVLDQLMNQVKIEETVEIQLMGVRRTLNGNSTYKDWVVSVIEAEEPSPQPNQ